MAFNRRASVYHRGRWALNDAAHHGSVPQSDGVQVVRAQVSRDEYEASHPGSHRTDSILNTLIFYTINNGAPTPFQESYIC